MIYYNFFCFFLIKDRTNQHFLSCYPQAPAYYPPIGVNHNKIQLVYREEWDLPPEKIYKGLCEGVRLDAYFAGFPSLKHIDHTVCTFTVFMFMYLDKMRK